MASSPGVLIGVDVDLQVRKEPSAAGLYSLANHQLSSIRPGFLDFQFCVGRSGSCLSPNLSHLSSSHHHRSRGSLNSRHPCCKCSDALYCDNVRARELHGLRSMNSVRWDSDPKSSGRLSGRNYSQKCVTGAVRMLSLCSHISFPFVEPTTLGYVNHVESVDAH